MTRTCGAKGVIKAAKSMKAAKSKKTAKRAKSTSPAARRARPATHAQKRFADITRYKTDMEKRRVKLSDEKRRGPGGDEVRLLAFPRVRALAVTDIIFEAGQRPPP
jgi:hypothetical protein